MLLFWSGIVFLVWEHAVFIIVYVHDAYADICALACVWCSED